MSYHLHAAAPPNIAASLPRRDLLRQVLPKHVIDISAGRNLVRAAWNQASVWPEAVTRTYRFGPHEISRTLTGFPFHWIYAAEEVLTATWEARLCSNPATLPGRFTFEPGAEKALIATLTFGRSLHMFDLSGVAASRLGIFDQLRSPDYEWCQWFGVEIDQILAEHRGRFQGFVYPSRRHPGARAYAISSRVHQALAQGLTTVVEQFVDTVEYAELLADPCCIEQALL